MGSNYKKPTYDTRKYNGSAKIRKYIAAKEGSDMAGQNVMFSGDAVGAKERELRKWWGASYNNLSENQRDALLSHYYNVKPTTFYAAVGAGKRLIDVAKTKEEYDKGLILLSNSFNTGRNWKGMSGLRIRRDEERKLFMGNGYTPYIIVGGANKKLAKKTNDIDVSKINFENTVIEPQFEPVVENPVIKRNQEVLDAIKKDSEAISTNDGRHLERYAAFVNNANNITNNKRTMIKIPRISFSLGGNVDINPINGREMFFKGGAVVKGRKYFKRGSKRAATTTLADVKNGGKNIADKVIEQTKRRVVNTKSGKVGYEERVTQTKATTDGSGTRSNTDKFRREVRREEFRTNNRNYIDRSTKRSLAAGAGVAGAGAVGAGIINGGRALFNNLNREPAKNPVTDKSEQIVNDNTNVNVKAPMKPKTVSHTNTNVTKTAKKDTTVTKNKSANYSPSNEAVVVYNKPKSNKPANTKTNVTKNNTNTTKNNTKTTVVNTKTTVVNNTKNATSNKTTNNRNNHKVVYRNNRSNRSVKSIIVEPSNDKMFSYVGGSNKSVTSSDIINNSGIGSNLKNVKINKPNVSLSGFPKELGLHKPAETNNRPMQIANNKINVNSIPKTVKINNNLDISNPVNTNRKSVTSKLGNAAKSVGNFFKNLDADRVSLLANTAGSLIGGLINHTTLNGMKAPAAPAPYLSANYKINYNINPQLDAIREAAASQNKVIDSNTASSQTAIARKQQVNNNAVNQATTIYGNKENEETKLINQAKLQQQNVGMKNTELYNNWRDRVTEFNNNIAEQKAANIVGTIEGLNAGVQDLFARRERRDALDNNIFALMASNPNVSPSYVLNTGLANGLSKNAQKHLKRMIANETKKPASPFSTILKPVNYNNNAFTFSLADYNKLNPYRK